jgi:hypothetical protein
VTTLRFSSFEPRLHARFGAAIAKSSLRHHTPGMIRFVRPLYSSYSFPNASTIMRSSARIRTANSNASVTPEVHTFPYHIIFVELADRPEVVAFAHNRRRPAYFMSRFGRV